MNGSKVSVCIPAYNGEKFIKECIDSVLAQTYPNFELIVVDDRSTDNTVSIIKSYTDPRIKFYQNETNLGLIGNWNKALSYATGDYIKILPDDDLIYPGCLELQVAVLDKDKKKEVALVSGRKHVINNLGKILFSRGYSKTETEVSGYEAINKTVRSGGNIIGEGGALLFRREIMSKAGIIDSDIFYILDLDYWFKILLNGKLHSLPDIVSAFRISATATSTRIKDEQQRDCINFIRKVYRDKKYQLTWINYRLGIINTVISTYAKKIIYKLFIK
jgi:glycosyltransferase involved in cell wall biosynthesis